MPETDTNPSGLLKPTMFNFRFLNIFLNIIDPFKILRNFFLKPIVTVMMNVFEDYKSKTSEKFANTQHLVLKMIVISIIIFLLICGAVLMYALFYLSYMPAVTHIKPVYMQYNKICDDNTCSSNEISPYHSFPSSHVQLTRRQQLMINQPYMITVQLDLPETPRNQDLGMFLICMDMKDAQGALKSHACRSTMLRYRSPLLHKVKTLLFMPLYILGIYEQKQLLDVEIYNDFVDTTNSVTDIYVEIHSKAVEFYSVKLHITAHFTGLRYIMFHFPVSSAMVGIAGNLMLLMFLTILCWYHWDTDLEWVEEARQKYVGGDIGSRSQDSSSIATTEENFSVIESESHALEDDDFIFNQDDENQNEKFSGTKQVEE